MSNKPTDKKVRSFVQVSLPSEFAEMLRKTAEASGRSMSGQIEHWTAIGKIIETIAPGSAISDIKTAKESSDILRALASFVINTDVDVFKKQYQSSGVVNYGTDQEKYPGVVFRYNIDGTTTPGNFDVKGVFVPNDSLVKAHKRNVVTLKPLVKKK